MNNTTCEILDECDSSSSSDPHPLLILPVVLSVLWVLFDVFYASSLLGFVVNLIVNLFLKDSGIHIGALHINLFTGRVLFKEIHYYCRDYSIRVRDGYVVFRWWKRSKESSCSKCATSRDQTSVRRAAALVFFQLNGFEYHWYNRSEVYDDWGKPKVDKSNNLDSDAQEESGMWSLWNDIQPSLHFRIKKGQIVLGNHLVEKSLVVKFDKAEAHYSTTEASNPYDELMHVINWHGMNVSVVLEPSVGYEGESQESLPIACDGTTDVYPVLKTDSADCTYSVDSPGLVPLGNTRGPKYAFDIQLGDNTIINYGCYANRQRTHLQKFFFPNDHTEHPVTQYPQPGEKRIFTFFDISVQLTSPGTFNLFFKDSKEEIHRLVLELGSESNIEINQPWTTDPDGSTSTVTGRLTDVRVLSSLVFQPLGKADTIEFKTDLHFPRIWNATQTWDMKFGASKVQANILFSYIDFANDLLDDWLGVDPPDLLSFVPIDWNISIDVSRYEIYLYTNRYNWVDVAKDGVENSRLGFCGTTGQINFEFPFTEFLPPEQKIAFSAHGQNIVVRQYIPPSRLTRESLFTLSSSNKHRWRVLEFQEVPNPPEERSEQSTAHSGGSTPSVRSKTGISKSSSLTLDSEREKESTLKTKSGAKFWIGESGSVSQSQSLGDNASTRPLRSVDTDAQVFIKPEDFQDNEQFPMGYRNETQYEKGWLDIACGPSITIDITYCSHAHDVRPGKDAKLKPNLLVVDIDAPTVLLRVFGSLARDLLALKENYPGEYIDFTAFNSTLSSCPPWEQERDTKPKLTDELPAHPSDYDQDEPAGRFISIIVDFKLRNITGEFPTHLPEGYPRDFPLPTAHTTVFAVHVEYLGHETKCVLHVDPFTVQVPSVSAGSPGYEMGNVACTGLDLNCHGFTEFMCEERVEYAWLMQLQVGRIMGGVSSEQLLQAVDWLHAAFIHIIAHGDGFRKAPNAKLIEPKVEPYAEDIKYKLFDLNILEADVHLLEGSTVTRIQCPGFDLSFCSLHSEAETLGLSLQLQGLTLSSYIPAKSDPTCMLECGSLDIGNIQGDLSLREIDECVPTRQLDFLKKADDKTKRLWFLWREEEGVGNGNLLCGCCGGCLFLDGCIQRQQPIEKIDSVVYMPRPIGQSESVKSELGSGYKSLGLGSLKKALPTLTIKEVDCVVFVHLGLLEHYELRYGKPPPPPDSTANGVEEQSETAVETSSIVSDSSFVSAQSDFTSESDEFVSVSNLNEIGLSDSFQVLERKRGKHRKTKSVLSQELRSMGKDSVDAPMLFYDSTAAYKGLVPSQSYKPTVLYIPMRKREINAEKKIQQQPRGSPLITHVKVQETISLPAQPSRSASATPQMKSKEATGHEVRNVFRLRVPVLTPLSSGSLPVMAQKGSGVTRGKRRRRRGVYRKETDENKLAKVSLSVSVNGTVTATVSPPILTFIERIVSNIHNFFEHKSALAILDAISNDTNGTAKNYIASLFEKSFPTEPQPPLLHVALCMAPGVFLGLQMLQPPQDVPKRPPPPYAKLKKIVRHGSLISAYLSGLTCNALIHTDVEVQQPRGSPERTDMTDQQSVTSKAKSRTLLNTSKVSVDVKCPVLQGTVCALIMDESEEESSFPGLFPVRSQLNFDVTVPTMADGETSTVTTVCNLFEVGTADVNITCVAKIIHSEISEDAILSWKNVQSYRLIDPTSSPKSDTFEMKNNKVVFRASIPLLWSQVATPRTGIPNEGTGGIDLLVLPEAIDAWKAEVEHLVESVRMVIEGKAVREKRVLLGLLGCAARSPLYHKPTNPLLSETSLSLRQTVVYHCMYQLRRSQPSFSEDLLATVPEESLYDGEILATALGLATRLLSLQEDLRDTDSESNSSVGYISISPSPSELALPNLVFANSRNFEDIDYDMLFSKVVFGNLVVLRESLLPFLLSAGVQVEPQLRTLCHNSAEMFVDFTVELQETSLYLEELVHAETSSASTTIPPSNYGSPTPTFYVEHFVVNGCLKYSSESSLQKSPNLSLLVKNLDSEGTQRKATMLSKMNVSAQCCISLDTLTTNVTVPLLKLCRHMVETSKLHPSWRQRFNKGSLETQDSVKSKLSSDAAAVPTLMMTGSSGADVVIPVEEIEEEEEEELQATEMDVWQFSQNILSSLVALEYQSIPAHASPEKGGTATPALSTASFSSTRPKLIDYPYTPRVPRAHFSSSPEKESKHFLPHRTAAPEFHSDSSTMGARDRPLLERDHRRLPSTASNASLTSDVGDVIAIQIDDVDGDMQSFGLSPEETNNDTYGGDTTDSQHVMSSEDNEMAASPPNRSSLDDPFPHPSSGFSSVLGSVTGITDIYPLTKSLTLSESELLFTVFGLLKINSIQLNCQVETTKGSLEFSGISGAVDARKAAPTVRSRITSPVGGEGEEEGKTPLWSKVLPTYLSVSATLKKSLFRVNDKGLPDSDLLLFSAHPIYCSIGICNSSLLPIPTYRCILKLMGLELDVKQSPIRMHKRFQQLMPVFNDIYSDIFAPSSVGPVDPGLLQQTSQTPLSDVKIPAKLPQGFIHFSLDKTTVYMAPLSSLSVTYAVATVTAQIETTHHINFCLGIGEQSLRFNPREHKDELSLRHIPLPTVSLKGEVRSRKHTRLPSVSAELAVKQVNVDVTTDVLNQLLILQNTFIKELNDLVQLFINIGESIPHHRERLERLASLRRAREAAGTAQTETELLSILDSCKLSLLGICITVSTPLSTALRFSTGKIDMLITNTGNQLSAGLVSPAKSQLLLSGRVEIDISLALGYLQDSGPDVVDDLCELAYFRTRISIRNTQQNVTRQQSVSGEEEQTASPLLMDTFLISILSPHLYIQSNAVEQGILFWLNCKSVYSYWQNERKQLNAEVQAATEEFMERINRPTHLQTPSIDFSKPRLVQITVSDVGACMPLTTLPSTPHSTQKAFPALVLTIKEMQLLLNLSHKVASTGKFSGFCIRFTEQFSIRQKTWTMDAKRHKFNNCGTVNRGTFKLCIAAQKRYSDTDASVVVGEKLITGFQWDMSGIDVNANTDIGRHLSTLVKTVTTIGSDLEGKQQMKRSKTGSLASAKPFPRRAVSTARPHHTHRRAMSLVVSSRAPPAEEDKYTTSLEQDLAIQTRKVTKLRYAGASRESLKSEEDALRQMERDLAREVGRMLRKREGISLHRLNQIFSPKAMQSVGKAAEEGSVKRKLSLAAKAAGARARKQLFSLSSEHEAITEEPIRPESAQPSGSPQESPQMRPRAHTYSGRLKPSHSRVKSDITDIMQYMRMEEGRRESDELPQSPHTQATTEESSFHSGMGMKQDDLRQSDGTPVEMEQEREFEIPTIDVEVNITINVDSGVIVLRSEESSGRRSSTSLPKAHSPHSRKLHYSQSLIPDTTPSSSRRDSASKHGPSLVDSVLMIPALKVKVRYQSIVGRSYSPNAPSIPHSHSPVPVPRIVMPSTQQQPPTTHTPPPLHKGVSWAEHKQVFEESPTPSRAESDEEQPEARTKRGVLSLSAVVSSLPEDIVVTPSLLEFIEQVARPTIAATVVTSSSSGTESDSTDVESETESTAPGPPPPAGESRPISFPVDVTITFQIQPSTVQLSCKPHSRVNCVFRSPDVNFVVSFSLFSKQLLENSFTMDDLESSQATSRIVTFNNLYITGCFTTFALTLSSPLQVSTLKQQDTDSPKFENKEALSLTLGQAFIHLSRKSVLAPSSKDHGKGVKSVDDYGVHSKLQVSVITNIASLVVGYDMRRLNDITAFRRYWYSTGLVEALFIGSKKPREGEQPGGLGIISPSTPSGEESSTEPSAIADIDNTISAAIVVAANVADFRIAANVAQVMGNANLLVTHLKCEAHADVSHNELVLFNLDAKMEKGEVDARGGFVAGSILMEEVQAHVTTDSQHGNIPVHKAFAMVQLIEGRVDYMSSCIMLGRATELNAQFYDSWEGLQLGNMESEAHEASVQLHADFTWEKLQLSIHQATTKNMFNIVMKMHEFIILQKRRSERTIGLMLPAGLAVSRALAAYREEQKRAEEQKEDSKDDNRHHWLWAMRVGSMDLMQALGIPIPSHGPPDVSLGGKFTISGQNMCLVCFHGPSFRETEWAVFNIDLINASFSTQAIPGLGTSNIVPVEGKEGYHQLQRRRTCQQILTLCLGSKDSRTIELAAIYRVSAGRTRVPPITGTNINNWLDYACIDLHLHPEKYESTSATPSALVKFSKKLAVQSVLLVPKFNVQLINDHFWPMVSPRKPPAVEGVGIPLVECSLVSRFSEGISVTTTVDHYLFLHDLVKGYIDYLERHKGPTNKSSDLSSEPGPTDKDKPTTQHRLFVSVCWELNPHLLLLSAVSGQFNPHISWLLERLGFKDAQTTIPKWIQRGAMDPLDMVVASLVELLVTLSAKKKLQLRAASPVSD